jgi:hypothetical protein
LWRMSLISEELWRNLSVVFLMKSAPSGHTRPAFPCIKNTSTVC